RGEASRSGRANAGDLGRRRRFTGDDESASGEIESRVLRRNRYPQGAAYRGAQKASSMALHRLAHPARDDDRLVDRHRLGPGQADSNRSADHYRAIRGQAKPQRRLGVAGAVAGKPLYWHAAEVSGAKNVVDAAPIRQNSAPDTVRDIENAMRMKAE